MFNVRGGKRKLTPAEDSTNAEVAENSNKNEGKVAETKRPKRQASAVDKDKVIVALMTLMLVCHHTEIVSIQDLWQTLCGVIRDDMLSLLQCCVQLHCVSKKVLTFKLSVTLSYLN